MTISRSRLMVVALVCSLSGVQVRSIWEDAGVTVMVHGCSALSEIEALRTLHTTTAVTTQRFNQLRSLIDEWNLAVAIWYIIYVWNKTERQRKMQLHSGGIHLRS
jgi:hypothetical protein